MSATTYQNTLRTIAAQAEDARKKVAEAIALVRADRDHTPEWKAAETRKLETRLLETSQTLAAEMREARDGLRAAASQVRDTRDQTERLLADQRAGRKWTEIRAQLEGGVDWQAVLELAAETGDHATMDALSAELPAYLASQVPVGLTRRDDMRQTMAATRRTLDAVLAQHANGPTREAAAIRHNAESLIANAAREVGAAEDTALGKFDAMRYSVEKHYAKQVDAAGLTAVGTTEAKPDVFGALADVIQEHYIAPAGQSAESTAEAS